MAVPPRHSAFTRPRGFGRQHRCDRRRRRSWSRFKRTIRRSILKQVFTTVDITSKTYHSSLEALIEGSILAVVVVWLFLRNWRATLISALAIPLSAIPTFAFMQWMGFTLNEITLLSLSLVAGVLVDDAIVEIENIVRHMRMGKSGYRAAMEAADEIGLAVVATSATIIAVFLPVSFMGGVSGQFFTAIRSHGRRGGVHVLDGGAHDHPGAGGLCARTAMPACTGRRPDHDRLRAGAEMVGRASLENHADSAPCIFALSVGGGMLMPKDLHAAGRTFPLRF